MYTELELRKRLEELAQEDRQAPDEKEAPALLDAMKAHIGSVDPVLRDDLIYSSLARWIIQDRLSGNLIRDLLQTLLDERHLFYRIDENDPDAVYTRSFSVLLLAPIIDAHCRHAFLLPEEIRRIKEQVVRYASRESDRRAYVDGPGWAHAAAHTSDTLDELARCGELNRSDLLDLLSAVSRFITDENQAYSHEEDERMSAAVIRIIGRQVLRMDEWNGWLNYLAVFAMEPRPFPRRMYARTNVRNLLRSVYFRLHREKDDPAAAPGISRDLRAALSDRIEQVLAAVTAR